MTIRFKGQELLATVAFAVFAHVVFFSAALTYAS